MKRYHRFLSILMIGLLASNEAAAERHHRSTATTKKAAPVDKREIGNTAEADDDAPVKPRKKEKAEPNPLDDISAVPIKLDEILEAAVAGNPELAKARSDRASAEGEAGYAERAMQWHLGGELDYTRESSSDHTDVAPFQQVGLDKITAALSLGRKLPTGGEVSLQFQLVRMVQEIYVPSEIDYNGQPTGDTTGTSARTSAKYVRHDTLAPPSVDTCGGDIDHVCTSQANLGIKLKQPLLRGLGSDVALADQHKAELGFSIATIKAQLAGEDMVKEVIHAYYELQFAAYEVEVRAESLKLAKGHEDLTRQEVRAGTAPHTQLDTVTYEIANREGDLLKAKQALVKKSLDLRRKVGLKIDHRNLIMRPSEAMEVGTEEWDEEETIARAHHANKRLAALELQRKVSNIEIGVAKDQTLPQLDATLSGGILGRGADPGKALNGLGGVTGFDVMAGLSFDIDLGGAAGKAVQAAQARAKKVDIDRDDMERQIDVEVANGVSTVASARKQVELADGAIVVANSNASAERLNFMANHSNNFQVMQRQTQLIESQLKRGRAIVDWHIAVADLQYLSGMLLEQYGISAITHASK